MTLRRILTYSDPLLREKSTPVERFDEDLAELARDMLETMYHDEGIGLAAPQIGVLKRLLVMDLSENEQQPLVLVNPEIISRTGEVRSEEGCLSIPGYRDVVNRSERVVVRAQDVKGDFFELEADDLLSRCIQHEIDHLDGVLFVDHLSRIKKEMFKRWLKRQESAAA